MSSARRLLPWFLWAQLLPQLFLGSRIALTYAATVTVLLVAAWALTGDRGEAAGLLGLARPRGDWVRHTALLLAPVIIWPRIVGIPFAFIWPETPVPAYPGIGPSAALMAVVLAPLAEELLFRGVLLAALRPYGRFAATVVSSVIFGMLHGPVVFASTVIVGWALAWLAWEHGSIWPGFGLHVAFNLTSGLGFFALEDSPGAVVMLLAVLVLLFLLSVVVVWRNRRLAVSVLADPWRERHVPAMRRPVIQALKLWPVAVTLAFAVLTWVLLAASPAEF